MEISIICVYNDRDVLENHLLKSLEKQTIEYELILLDNTLNKFNSSAEALNYGGRKAKGQYLMFIHQDFEFCFNTALIEILNTLKTLENIGIAGVAGKYSRNCVSNIYEGQPPVRAGQIHITDPVEVQIIDECVIIIPKKIFEKLQFDEVTCDNWHLYAHDYCLAAKRAGYKVYVLPIAGYHASDGNSFNSKAYYPTLKKFIEKYKNDYKWINTTAAGSWATFYPLSIQILYFKTLSSIGKKLKR